MCVSMCLTWLYLKKLCFSELLVNMCMESAIITSNDLAICSVHKLLSVSVLLCRQLLITKLCSAHCQLESAPVHMLMW